MLNQDVIWQDEMVALQRINSYSFLLGYLGFLASWILDTVYSLLHKAAVKTANDSLKSVVMVLSPHSNLARWGVLVLPYLNLQLSQSSFASWTEVSDKVAHVVFLLSAGVVNCASQVHTASASKRDKQTA